MSQRAYDEVQGLRCYEVVRIRPTHKEHIQPRIQERISNHMTLMIDVP
ncbi:MAG: hypothetical protein AAB687_00670 [Patescibacteria group bacterium]